MSRKEADGGGRGGNGRFARGNPGGPGNPHAKKVGQLRSALLETVSNGDMREIVAKLVAQAKAGDIHAAREVILRTLGRPIETDLLERLERLEDAVSQTTGRMDT